MKEIWKDVIEFENMYQISNKGNVKSLKRKSVSGKILKERLLSPSKDTKGYLRVSLHKENKSYHRSVHRLVAQTFLGNKIELQVNHKDGDKTNNITTNLEWCSNKENSEHAYNTNLKQRDILNPAISIKSINIETKKEVNHYSINQAAKTLRLYPSNILKVLKGKFKQSGGYMFEYL